MASNSKGTDSGSGETFKTVKEPEIELTPSSQNFGSVDVGECSGEYSFTLKNTGRETATGSVSVTSSQFSITQGSGSFSLGAGATKTIKVKFCPTSEGYKSATLLADGSNCDDDSSSLSGTGINPEIPTLYTDPDPPSHDFGTVLEGQTRSWKFDVTNCGTGTLTWTASDDQSWIGITPVSGSTTTETDEVTVTIDTTGLSAGIHTGHVTIDAGAGGSRTGTIIVTVEVPVLTTITVDPATLIIVECDTQTFTATTLDQYGDPFTATVAWDSSSITVGTIDASTGVFTAVAAGTTIVTATSGSVTGTASVTVTEPPAITLTWQTEPPTPVTQGDEVTFDVSFSECVDYYFRIEDGTGGVVWRYPTTGTSTATNPSARTWTTTTDTPTGDYTIIININGVDNLDTRTVTVRAAQTPTVTIATDAITYSPGDTMIVTLDIANPTGDPLIFEWYIGVPHQSIWVTYARAPIPAGFDNSYTIPIPVGNWGPTPFDFVHYVRMLDPVSGEVLVYDVAWCTYRQDRGEAMSVDIAEELSKTAERVELSI
jgi:hypothetical protein